MAGISKISNIWLRRTKRERFLLSIAGLALGAWLIIQFVYTPVHERYGMQLAAFEKASSDLVWLRQQANLINRAQSNLRIPGKDILALIQNSTVQFKITNADLEKITDEEGNNYIQADISATDGKNMMKWINYLASQGLILLTLNIKTLEQGKVEALLAFSAK